MNLFLILAFLFFMGSIAGWIIELFFRRFLSSSNPERKWINPGFCTGPYLPLYGSGLCALYLIANAESAKLLADPFWNKALFFIIMAISMTAIEFIAGIISVKIFKVRLWDYNDEWGNIMGIICPKYSLAWAALGAIYYFLIHPYILNALAWLSQNLAFSFVIGLFFGIFLIDVAHSMQLVSKLKQFADENEVIVKYENIKANIRMQYERAAKKYQFFRPFKTDRPLNEHLKEMRDTFEKRIKKTKKNSK